MRHFPLRECGYALGFFALLLAIYVGSYCAMVERWELVFGSATYQETRVVALYRFGDEHAVWFFGPAHKVDGWLRPDMWRDEEDQPTLRGVVRIWGRQVSQPRR
jgi:hypothetical protein